MIFLKHLRGQVDPIELMGDWIEELQAVVQTPQGLEALESLLR